jgi:hypothetical protein
MRLIQQQSQQQQQRTHRILLLAATVAVMVLLSSSVSMAFHLQSTTRMTTRLNHHHHHHDHQRRVFHRSSSSSSTKTELSAWVDPNSILLPPSLVVHDLHSVMDIPALLSTMYTTALPSAHGHSNPLFGPPDPLLAQIKSIAPSAKALMDMGISSSASSSATASSSDVATLASDAMNSVTSSSTSSYSPELQAKIQGALQRGIPVRDATTTMTSTTTGLPTHLPGFVETRHILPSRTPPPAETEATFAAQVEWAAQFLNVIDKLPFVAFYYALLEFFILRPGIDLYKEDVENDPAGVLAESVVVLAVRVAVFCVVGIVTVGIFG